jgi:nitrogen regulatory protein PII
MSTDEPMIFIIAQIRPNMEGKVVNALHDLPEFPGFTVLEVRGQGRGRGVGGGYQVSELDLTYQRHLQIQIVCRTGMVKDICDAIAAAAWTGRRGDGVIFATDAKFFARIRESRNASEGVNR